MRICLDTNVIIDIMGHTEDFVESYIAFDLALLKRFAIFIPVTSTTDINYILPRRNLKSAADTKSYLAQLLELVEVLDARQTDVASALASSMPDYEDALIAHMALRNNIDLIITRNLKDFTSSPVPAISPKHFVQTYKPKNYQYTLLDEADGAN